MINSNELNISNKSYTKKEFAQIYPELLDLCKKLTNKWDPSQSNESDPGVVLLKLCGFIADKLNYNIDKNILECFLPSATQETAARSLYEMQGYEMAYYKSAIIKPSFRYIERSSDEIKLGNNEITLPKFTTVLTDIDNNYKYTLLEDIKLTTAAPSGNAYTFGAIEGTVEKLTVNDSDLILLSNMDQYNRIYLPSIYAAQNGCFVYQGSQNFTQVSNLNVCDLNSLVFKFGYSDEKKLPYIEFPRWISNIINNGLTIYYTISSGQNGNTGDIILTKFLDKSEITLSDNTVLPTDRITISYLKSASGYDPEDIDSAYNNFKKQIGTFNTLVTCRDYMNYIYNLTNSDNSKIVSNVLVTDRRNDINYSSEILTFDSLGERNIFKPDMDENGNPKITASDLIIYGLNPYQDIDNFDDYKNSFKPINDNDLERLQLRIESPEELQSKAVSSLARDYKKVTQSDIFLLKNYYNLNIKLATVDKVNDLQEKSIVNNVRKALYKNFNASKLDYGYEIPYDSILKVIENSDNRIKTVLLDEPELETYVVKKDGSEVSLLSSEGSSYNNLILAKNILAGRIELYDYSTDFEIDYGYEATDFIKRIKSISTSTNLQTSTSDLPAEYSSSTGNMKVILGDNEFIQFIVPRFEVAANYSYGVNYRCNLGTNTIPADTIYQLVGSETIELNYTNTAEQEINLVLKAGDIIQSTIELKTLQAGDGTVTKNGKEYKQLQVKETINTMQEVQIILADRKVECLWMRNNEDNALFREGESDVILEQNEYFIYKNPEDDSLQILGSGTILSRNNSTSRLKMAFNFNLDQNNVKETDLVEIDFSQNNLTIKDASIYSFTKDDICLMRYDWSNAVDTITSNFKTLDKPTTLAENPAFVYKINGDAQFTAVPFIRVSGVNIKVRSRLDLNAGPNLLQKLEDRQQIIIKYFEDDTYSTINTRTLDVGSEPVYLKFNSLINTPGGTDIDLSVTSFSSLDETTALTYDISLVILTQEDTLPYKAGTKTEIDINNPFTTKFSTLLCEEKDVIIPIYVNSISTGSNDDKPIVILNSNKSNLMNCNNLELKDSSVLPIQVGLNNILVKTIDDDMSELQLKLYSNTLAITAIDYDDLILSGSSFKDGIYVTSKTALNSDGLKSIYKLVLRKDESDTLKYNFVRLDENLAYTSNDNTDTSSLNTYADLINDDDIIIYSKNIDLKEAIEVKLDNNASPTVPDSLDVSLDLKYIFKAEPISVSKAEISLDNIRIIDGYNSKFEDEGQNIHRLILNLDKDKSYNYVFNKDYVKLLDSKHVNTPYSLWDVNNKANIFTLPYLNLDPKSKKTTISVLRSSKI